MEHPRSTDHPDADSPTCREIEHTGDLGIEVTAPSLPVLFEQAARCMFSLIADVESVQPRESVEVTVGADDREALLVRWLSEINYLHLTRRMLFSEFAVTRMTDHILDATARGERFVPSRHSVFTEIKAVTFHGMRIREEQSRFRVQVIFDM